MRHIFFLVVFSGFLGCGLNQKGSEVGEKELYVEPLQLTQTQVIKFNKADHDISEVELIFPICLTESLNPDVLVEGDFKVTFAEQIQEIETNPQGCLIYSFVFDVAELNQLNQYEKELLIEGIRPYDQRIEIPVMIYREGDKILLADKRFSQKQVALSESITSPRESNDRLFASKLNISLEEQNYRIRKSLELKISRQMNLSMQLEVMHPDFNGAWSKSPYLVTGDFQIRFTIFSSEFKKNQFAEHLSACSENCVIATHQKVVQVKNNVIDDFFELEFFFHHTQMLSSRSVFLIEVESREKNGFKSQFIGEMDFFNESNKGNPLKSIILNEDLEKMVQRHVTMNKILLNHSLPVATPPQFLEKLQGAKENKKLVNLLNADLGDLSFMQRKQICGLMFDSIDFLDCWYDSSEYLQGQRFSLLEGQEEVQAKPKHGGYSTTIHFSNVNLHERRFDDGFSKGTRHEESFFTEMKLNSSVGVKALGNGAALEGEVGVKADRKRYRSWYETTSQSKRERTQKTVYNEFMVDEFSFENLKVMATECILFKSLDGDKKFYACEGEAKEKIQSESYFFIRPARRMDGTNSLIDNRLYITLLSRTFFGRMRFDEFVQAIEKEYIYFIETKDEFNGVRKASDIFQADYQAPVVRVHSKLQ